MKLSAADRTADMFRTAPSVQPDPVSQIEFKISNMRLVNPLNGSQGFSRKAALGAAARRKSIRACVRDRVYMSMRHCQGRAWHITLVRVAPGRFDDDNLRAAFKAVRDGVADALGFKDDSDHRLEWSYAQNHGLRMSRKLMRPAQHDVVIIIEAI